MNYKTFFRSGFLLKIIFATSLFLLIFISTISYKHTNSLTESTKLLVHSYKMQIELDQLLSYVKDAETGHGSYIISRDSIFLRSFNEARDKVSKSFIALIKLTGNKHEQQENVDSLYQLISLRFGLLVNSLEQAGNNNLNNGNLQTDRNILKGKYVMDMIRSQTERMLNQESNYLKEQQKKYELETFFTPYFTLLLLLFSLAVFSISYFKINKDFENLKDSNENLLITSASIKHAEEIGGFSSWQWNLDSNEFIYSDNQFRLLGCEPQSFEPSVEKFLEFVHPADRHILVEAGIQVRNDKNFSPTFYRIIRKDGEIRYFKSLGKLLHDVQGKKIFIGINCDITEQHISNIALEERNRDLEQSNKELASFNHIASHDLQEPLRKVQTFISRISDKDLSSISEEGREYFSRIQAAVDRMRILIEDLLLFSRANKNEKVFEKADLNEIFEAARQELSQDIEDKKARIQTAKLPVLSVIPFQIQQLFTNLISNSLKYSRDHVPPVIKITCDKIIAKDYSRIKTTDLGKKFYKFSVTDNGMGFEQQYAENIFILFHRLHHVSDFPGTGIGLSICKKIVENHGGYIEAEGHPDKGSTFTFYLPE
jgi:signal transduction histidine kinase/CHASE3 domain sensor protein